MPPAISDIGRSKNRRAPDGVKLTLMHAPRPRFDQCGAGDQAGDEAAAHDGWARGLADPDRERLTETDDPGDFQARGLQLPDALDHVFLIAGNIDHVVPQHGLRRLPKVTPCMLGGSGPADVSIQSRMAMTGRRPGCPGGSMTIGTGEFQPWDAPSRAVRHAAR